MSHSTTARLRHQMFRLNERTNESIAISTSVWAGFSPLALKAPH
jgi:hypothetical protein